MKPVWYKYRAPRQPTPTTGRTIPEPSQVVSNLDSLQYKIWRVGVLPFITAKSASSEFHLAENGLVQRLTSPRWPHIMNVKNSFRVGANGRDAAAGPTFQVVTRARKLVLSGLTGAAASNPSKSYR